MQFVRKPDTRAPLANFFDGFSKKNKKLIETSAMEYAGLGSLLKDVWGFH
ncbi:MAG: hypothetical protein R3188_07375 [Acidiferrobacterales bacterium]|nr:hypothetical protein [Acidiferrobacterales bacterium]